MSSIIILYDVCKMLNLLLMFIKFKFRKYFLKVVLSILKIFEVRWTFIGRALKMVRVGP